VANFITTMAPDAVRTVRVRYFGFDMVFNWQFIRCHPTH